MRFLKWLRRLIEFLLRLFHPRNATHVVFTSGGKVMTELKLRVGETKKVLAHLRRKDGTEDDTFESPSFGYPANSDGVTAADGSSSIAPVAPDQPLVVAVTGLQVSPLDGDGAPIPSVVRLKVDVESGAPEELIDGTFAVTVLAANADRVEFEELPA
jgi:hypothetical protein